MEALTTETSYFSASKLNEKIIRNLIDGSATAVRIKNFIDIDTCSTLSEKILNGGFEHYINAKEIGRIGMAFYETDGNSELLEKYFGCARDNVEELRSRCFPYINPIDVVRCQLDECWPAGATLEKVYGQKMYVGLSRVVEPGVYFLAHHDFISKDAPDSFDALSIVKQLAVNVYLQMPDSGGEIEIWNKPISPKEFDDMRGDSYGVPPELLGEPDVTICPEIGDLVLFDSNKMHAVRPSANKSRLSLSFFLGYRGDHMPLSFWS